MKVNTDKEWTTGYIKTYSRDFEVITVNDHVYNIRNVPRVKKKDIKIGDLVFLTYKKGNQYNVLDLTKRGETMVKKKTEEFIELIENLEPFVGGTMMESLSNEDREYLLQLYTKSIDQAIAIFDITATFDDTKKKTEDLAQSILEGAFAITIIVDGNTKQVLKKHLPKEEK